MTTVVRGGLNPGIFCTQETFWNFIQYTTASKPVYSTVHSITQTLARNANKQILLQDLFLPMTVTFSFPMKIQR